MLTTLPPCYRCHAAPCTCADGVSLYGGDALFLLTALAPASLDAVITDPPYSSGGQFRGDRTQTTLAKYISTDSAAGNALPNFIGDVRDQRSFTAWSTLWMAAALHAAKSGAILAVFTDWRQLPATTDAVQAGGWVWRTLATWHKPGIRMQRGRLSGSAEYVVYGSSGIPTPGETSPQNVLACQPVPIERRRHIAEKPLPVLEWLVGLTPPGATILDPFCGSGTTLEAAKKAGRRAIGFDLAPDNLRITADRLAQENLFC